MLCASFKPYDLYPFFPLGTSRGKITKRRVWFLKMWHKSNPEVIGIGEAAPLPGLSFEEPLQVEEALNRFCQKPTLAAKKFNAVPSVRFAIEMALTDLLSGGTRQLFKTRFCHSESFEKDRFTPIPINGLVWMGNRDEMLERLTQKIDEGYRCMKMKIGAIDREQEFELLKIMRDTYSKDILEIRVDANGAFSPEEAPAILERLARLEIHSIEQPIAPSQATAMKQLCAESAIPIALDEELILSGLDALPHEKSTLLHYISPQYIILKPTLLGGFTASEEWISAAEEHNIKWWVTSALESNIGLNAIAQWTASLSNPLPQGLGTGALFKNNITAPLEAKAGELRYLPNVDWDLSPIR